jgi:biotin synthase
MVANMSIKQLLDKVLKGNDLIIEEANMLISPDLTDLTELIQVSNTITHRYFNKKIEMCAIYPAKIGRCSGDCAFCAQSAYHKSNVMPVSVHELNDNEIIANANELRRLGVNRYSLVTSGEHLTDEEFDRILRVFQRLHDETEIGLCASLGSLTLERATRLRDVGVSRYHHNIETSRNFFPRICSTHTYDDKIVTLNIARQSGLEICCGGIISMGETPEQRVEMAFALKELDVDCVPINILNPIPGTRLENQQPLSVEEILRTIAVFRFILTDKSLRFAGGREKALGQNEYLGYTAGINALIVGNYLTTPGKSFKQENSNLEMAGLEL